MPVYSWVCEKCGNTTEVVRSVAEYETVPSNELDGGGKENLDYCTVDEKNGAQSHKWSRYIPQGSGNFHLIGRGWAKTGYNKW